MRADELRNLPLEKRVLAPIFRQRVDEDASRPFLRMGGRHFTYGEFGARTLALARGLAKLGVGPGSVVPILLKNCPEYVMAWFAVHLRGATMALVNPGLKGQLLVNAIEDCAPRVVILGSEQLSSLAELDTKTTAAIEHVVVVGDLAFEGGLRARTMPIEKVMEESGQDPVVATTFDEVQTIFFTSGSTGRAKGVLMPNAHFFANPCSFLRLSALQRDDVLHTSLPLFHGVGSRQGVLPAFMIGAQVDLGEKFSLSRFWQTVSEAKATVALLTPSMPPLLAAQPPSPLDRAHGLRAVYNVAPDESFERRFGVRMLVSFAITEVGVIIYTPYGERRLGAMGRAHQDWELAIVDDADRPVPAGTVGELVCRPKKSFLMMQGYLKRPEAAAAAWRNLWYHTGDFMRQDADGYFYFAGRDQDRIRRRGENISPIDIEAELRSHPAVADCVAIGHPADDGEDDIRVVLVGRADTPLPPPPELAAWLAGRLPRSMQPRYYEYVVSLPMTATDKVDRRAVREGKLTAGAWDADSRRVIPPR